MFLALDWIGTLLASVFYRRNAASRRRAINSLLMAVLLVGMVGLPVRGPAPEKEGRFPCEHHLCGCSTAEQCWDQCCCYSDAEKLSWAAANGISPPAFLTERVASAHEPLAAPGQSNRRGRVLGAKRRCCSAGESVRKPPASYQARAGIGKGEPECGEVQPAADERGKLKLSLTLIRLESVAKCRGIDVVWAKLFGMAVVTGGRPWAKPEPPLLGRLRPVDESALTIFLTLDPPVPLGGSLV